MRGEGGLEEVDHLATVSSKVSDGNTKDRLCLIRCVGET